jgi:glycosyltransferase involved in cell wall biosynthesis
MNVKKPHILYLSYDGMTDPLGRSQVLSYLIGLSEKGIRYTLISFEKEGRFEKSRKEIEQLCARHSISWIPLPYTKSPPVLSTLYDVWVLKRTVKKIYKEDKFDIVHCRSYITSLAGVWLKEQFGVKYIFDMRGFYADERADGGLWPKGHPVYGMVYSFFKKQEKRFLNTADYTISLTEAGKRIIQSWKELNNQPVPIQVIPCCADLALFNHNNIDKKRVAELRRQFGIAESDFVISYLGSIGTWYMLPEMLHFFKVLLKHRPESKFLFITNEGPENILPLAVQKGIATDRLIINPASHKDVPNYLGLSQVSVFFIKPVFSKKASSPTKQGEIMGMGMPHICNAGVGDVDDIVSRTHSGYVVQHLTEEEYEIAVKNLDKILSISAVEIRAGAEQVYSLEDGVERYFSVYQKLLA